MSQTVLITLTLAGLFLDRPSLLCGGIFATVTVVWLVQEPWDLEDQDSNHDFVICKLREPEAS